MEGFCLFHHDICEAMMGEVVDGVEEVVDDVSGGFGCRTEIWG